MASGFAASSAAVIDLLVSVPPGRCLSSSGTTYTKYLPGAASAMLKPPLPSVTACWYLSPWAAMLSSIGSSSSTLRRMLKDGAFLSFATSAAGTRNTVAPATAPLPPSSTVPLIACADAPNGAKASAAAAAMPARPNLP